MKPYLTKSRQVLPRYLFQSALFPAIRKIPTLAIKREVAAFNQKNFTVIADTLTQFDLSILLALRKLTPPHDREQAVQATLAQLIGAMARKDGSQTRESVARRLTRCNHYLIYEGPSGQCFEGFCFKALKITSPSNLEFIWHPEYLALFEHPEENCLIDIDRILGLYSSLKGWLYGFMCANPTCQSAPLVDLKQLTGQHYHDIVNFRKAISQALASLYTRGLIEWTHGIKRDGTVFWRLVMPTQ